MKKTLIALLSVMIMMIFVASAFALHAVPEMFEYTPSMVKSKKAMITLGGEIRVRGIYENNNDLVDTETDGTTNDDQEAYYDERIRLNIKATVSPNTMGFVELETGNNGSADNAWGTCASDAQGVYKDGNCKNEHITYRQAYIAHQGTGLGVLSGWKAGHMLLALGNGLFFNHTDFGDDAVVLWLDPVEGLELSLITIKFTDQVAGGRTADDADAYVGSVDGKMGGFNYSGDLTYVHDNTGPGVKLWNLGLRGGGTAGIFSFKADVEFQDGKIEKTQNGLQDDYDIGGWAFLVGADLKLGAVNLGAEIGYGSGDDIDTEDEYEGFVTSLADGQRSTFLVDYRLPGAGQAIGLEGTTNVNGGASSSTYANGKNYGLNNTLYLNVGVDSKVTPDLKISADIYHLVASEPVNDDNNTTSQDLEDQYIGLELDGKIQYQIDTNLVWYIEGGYLWAGDFYKNATRGKDKNNMGNNNYSADPDNAYTVRHGLVLKF